MSNALVFKQPGSVAPVRKGELSELAKSLASASNVRRIQTNTNGTFKLLVNGEPIGKAIRGEIDVIIVSALPKVSRIYYANEYDPNAEATLPNCWSNLGDRPEEAAEDKQHTNCSDCPMNIKGSGKNGTRACRFQRRIGVLLAGDPSGEVYQFSIPSKSLFGKGTGNVHPFESYIKYLIANGQSPDMVVTNISYDLNADQMELLFTPVRYITEQEAEMVQEAQARPETEQLTRITVAQADKVTKLAKTAPAVKPEPVQEKPKVTRSEEPEDEDGDVPPPTTRGKRGAKKPEPVETETAPVDKNEKLASILESWVDED